MKKEQTKGLMTTRMMSMTEMVMSLMKQLWYPLKKIQHKKVVLKTNIQIHMKINYQTRMKTIWT